MRTDHLAVRDDRPDRLAAFVRDRGLGLEARSVAWSGHVGACLTDAVLQAHRNYDLHVEPRVARFRSEHPDAATVSGFLTVCGPRPEGPARWCELVAYKSLPRGTRVLDLADLLMSQGVETAEDARRWLDDPSSVAALRRIHGVGPKTAAYVCGLFGVPGAVAVDVRLERALEAAEITWAGWNDARHVIAQAAVVLEIDPWILDGALWKHANELGSVSPPSSTCSKSR